MEDIEWATTMADPDTAPDYFLDALRNARELGHDGYAQEVVGTAVNMLIDSEALNPVINALLLSLPQFFHNLFHLLLELYIVTDRSSQHGRHASDHFDIPVNRVDERLRTLPCEKLPDRSARAVLPLRLRVRSELMKHLLSLCRHASTQRIQAAHQRPVLVDPASLRG